MPIIKKNEIELGNKLKSSEESKGADFGLPKEKVSSEKVVGGKIEKTENPLFGGKELEEREGAGSREVAGIPASQSAVYATEEREKEVEEVLSNNLEDIYLNMPPDKQKEFKAEGEKTAQEINTLLSKTKVKVKKIVALIKRWLSVIPGVNKFFLEQESKIKTDEIMKLKNKL